MSPSYYYKLVYRFKKYKLIKKSVTFKKYSVLKSLCTRISGVKFFKKTTKQNKIIQRIQNKYLNHRSYLLSYYC